MQDYHDSYTLLCFILDPESDEVTVAPFTASSLERANEMKEDAEDFFGEDLLATAITKYPLNKLPSEYLPNLSEDGDIVYH